MTAADILVKELVARGVRFVATLNGHGLDPFYLACKRADLRVIDVRNEQAAGYMAEVAGRLTRSVGVCAVSGAVAHVNALSGVLNARFDGAPMLLITGITPLADLGKGNFQDFNPVPMTGPVTKFARILDLPDRVGDVVHEAFTAATTGRPGPVHLSLPMDVAAADVSTSPSSLGGVHSGQVRHDSAATPEQVEEALGLIRRAKRPVLVAGSGVYYSRGERALQQFAQQQNMPVVTPIWDRGSVPEPMEQFMGVVGAATGSADLLPDADLVIMAGAEFDYRVGQLQPPVVRDEATVIRIHVDEAACRAGRESQLSIHAAPSVVLRQLAEACRAEECPASDEWLAEAKRRRDAHRDACLAAADKLPNGTSGRDVVLAIGQVLTDETVLLVDGGNIGQWFHQLLLDRYPGHWVTCGASGVVGSGLAGAMAAKAVHPTRPVVLLSGDGSFTFTISELECAARQGLPFVAVVADDQQWGISVTGHMKNHGQPLFSTLGPTRLDQVAEGFGCRGLRIDRKEDLPDAIRQSLSEDVPTVIQVPIVPGSPAGE